jgi:DNA gyrase subunit B
MLNSDYDESHITVLTMQESVRKRPGMYIGNLGFKGKKNLIFEVIDTYLDKKEGAETTLEITLKKDDFIEISFDSDAIKGGFAAIFKQEGIDLDWLAVANMLSQSFEIRTPFGCQIFERGTLISTDWAAVFPKNTLLFKLDNDIFEDITMSYNGLNDALKSRAILHKNVSFLLKDERKPILIQNYWHYTEGVKHYLTELQSEEDSYTQNDSPIFFFEEQIEDIHYAFGFYYGGETPENTMISYVNNDKLIAHGSLTDGIVDGIIATAEKIVRDDLYPLKDHYGNKITLKFSKKRAMKGLRLFASVKMENPVFGGSTKDRLIAHIVYLDAKKMVLEKLFPHFTSREALINSGYESPMEGFMRLFYKF